jgi:WD40 repeat protein
MVDISPDQKRALAASTFESNWDNNTLGVWCLETNTNMLQLKPEAYTITCAVFSPDGRLALSGTNASSLGARSGANTILLWDVETGACVQKYNVTHYFNPVNCIDFLPDGKSAIMGNEFDGAVNLFDVNSGRSIKEFRELDAWVSSLSVYGDGKTIAAGSKSGQIMIWDIYTGECLQKINGHTGAINSIRISPCGRIGLSGGDDAVIRAWDLESGKCIAAYDAGYAVNDISKIRKGNEFACAIKSGQVIFLRLEGNDLIPASVTITRLWRYGNPSGKWDDKYSVQCTQCGGSFVPRFSIIHTIDCIQTDAGLPSNQSPCLNLPRECWIDPALLSRCPICQKPIRYNPYIVDNSSYTDCSARQK